MVFSCSKGNIALLHYAVCFVPLFLVMVSLPFIYWKAYRKGSYLENKKKKKFKSVLSGLSFRALGFLLTTTVHLVPDPDLEISKGVGLQKKNLGGALWASVKSKNKRKSRPPRPFPKSAAGIRAWFLATYSKGNKRKIELPNPGRRDSHMKGACQKFWIKSLKETNLGVAQPILPPKRDHFKLVRKQKMHWKYIFFFCISLRDPKKDLYSYIIMVFCSELPKWDQNLKFYTPKRDDEHPCPFHMGVPPGLPSCLTRHCHL